MSNVLQDKLHENTSYFVEKMQKAGFDIKPTQSAICAVMLYDAKLSQDMTVELPKEGIYVVGFYYPVVPNGQARISVQILAAHEYVYVGIITGAKNINIGDRVTDEGHITCGHCWNCRRGKLHVCENSIGVGVNHDGTWGRCFDYRNRINRFNGLLFVVLQELATS